MKQRSSGCECPGFRFAEGIGQRRFKSEPNNWPRFQVGSTIFGVLLVCHHEATQIRCPLVGRWFGLVRGFEPHLPLDKASWVCPYLWLGEPSKPSRVFLHTPKKLPAVRLAHPCRPKTCRLNRGIHGRSMGPTALGALRLRDGALQRKRLGDETKIGWGPMERAAAFQTG